MLFAPQIIWYGWQINPCHVLIGESLINFFFFCKLFFRFEIKDNRERVIESSVDTGHAPQRL